MAQAQFNLQVRSMAGVGRGVALNSPKTCHMSLVLVRERLSNQRALTVISGSSLFVLLLELLPISWGEQLAGPSRLFCSCKAAVTALKGLQ